MNQSRLVKAEEKFVISHYLIEFFRNELQVSFFDFDEKHQWCVLEGVGGWEEYLFDNNKEAFEEELGTFDGADSDEIYDLEIPEELWKKLRTEFSEDDEEE